jgi:hypothetical protein
MKTAIEVERISKLARRASEGFATIECPALACASGELFEAKTGLETAFQWPRREN